jgi:hypothetical protein
LPGGEILVSLELNQSVRRWLLLTALVTIAGCQGDEPSKHRRQAAPPPGAATPYTDSFSARGWTFHLRRFQPDAAVDAVAASELWRNLFNGMANDPETRDLLIRLHAGHPVEFVVLDADKAEDSAALTAPPREGYAFAMRVADTSLREEHSGTITVPGRVIAYGRTVLIKDGVVLAASDIVGAVAEASRNAPTPGEPLDLAMQDYLLRQAPGWTVIGGPVFDSETLPASAQEQRKALDVRIKEYADQAAAFYGRYRKPS